MLYARSLSLYEYSMYRPHTVSLHSYSPGTTAPLERPHVYLVHHCVAIAQHGRWHINSSHPMTSPTKYYRTWLNARFHRIVSNTIERPRNRKINGLNNEGSFKKEVRLNLRFVCLFVFLRTLSPWTASLPSPLLLVPLFPSFIYNHSLVSSSNPMTSNTIHSTTILIFVSPGLNSLQKSRLRYPAAYTKFPGATHSELTAITLQHPTALPIPPLHSLLHSGKYILPVLLRPKPWSHPWFLSFSRSPHPKESPVSVFITYQ